MNDKLIKEIRRVLDRPDLYSNYYLSELLHKALVDSGESKLEHYNRGCEDAWELARKIAIMPSVGGYTTTELDDIFGSDYEPRIFESNSGLEALAKVEAYEKKKKEEAEKPVIGDVVVCNGGINFKGILIGENNDTYEVLTVDDNLAQLLPKNRWIITKTGKHFDIQGMMNEIKTED